MLIARYVDITHIQHQCIYAGKIVITTHVSNEHWRKNNEQETTKGRARGTATSNTHIASGSSLYGA